VKIKDLKEQVALIQSKQTANYEFTPENVLQLGSPESREIIGQLIDQILLPGSRIDNWESLKELWEKSQKGESTLILAEHYSNFDFPAFYRIIEKTPELGKQIADSILPIRGMKLTETSPVIATLSRSYDSIIIYPSRALDAIKDPEELAKVRKISVPINHAAMKAMIREKHNGRMILVFPSGTRYRPWAPESKKGVREIYSYLKTFDNVIFVAVNGNSLPPHESDDMTEDVIQQDLVIFTCSDIYSGKDFVREMTEKAPEDKEPKQFVVDQVMNILEEMHNKVEPERLKELEALHIEKDFKFK